MPSGRPVERIAHSCEGGTLCRWVSPSGNVPSYLPAQGPQPPLAGGWARSLGRVLRPPPTPGGRRGLDAVKRSDVNGP
eukprot:13872753-Heterocapsa_arctica.AAC.1